MGEAFDLAEQGEQRGAVLGVGAEQGVDERLTEFGDVGDEAVAALLEIAVGGSEAERLAGERVAVGVEPVGGECDQAVAGGDRFAGDRAVAIDDADDRAGEIELAGLVDIGHVGGFAAKQGDVGVAAGVGDAGDDLRLALLAEAVAGEVIEEEERFRAGGEDVVDAVVDEVAPDGVEALGEAGDEDFGADAIGGGGEGGAVAAVEGGEVEEAAECADCAELFGAAGTLGEFAVALDEAVVGVDVHAGGAVAGRAGWGAGGRACGRGAEFGGVAHGQRSAASWIGALWGAPLRSRASLSISSWTGTGYSPVKQARQEGLPRSTALSSPSMLR